MAEMSSETALPQAVQEDAKKLRAHVDLVRHACNAPNLIYLVDRLLESLALEGRAQAPAPDWQSSETAPNALLWEYVGEELAIFWESPYGHGREKIASFWWPAHPQEATQEVEQAYEAIASRAVGRAQAPAPDWRAAESERRQIVRYIREVGASKHPNEAATMVTLSAARAHLMDVLATAIEFERHIPDGPAPPSTGAQRGPMLIPTRAGTPDGRNEAKGAQQYSAVIDAVGREVKERLVGSSAYPSPEATSDTPKDKKC